MIGTTLSSLPAWNDDWESADPLRGKPGWMLPDYVNIGVSVCLIATTVGVLLPAVPTVLDIDARAQRLNELREVDLRRVHPLGPKISDVGFEIDLVD